MSYSATQLARKLDISRSYLYYLKDNGVIEVEINDNGRVIWNEEAYQKLSEYIKKNKANRFVDSKEIPKEYKTTKINNRRYLGNKYKLLPFITRVVENECKNINRYPESVLNEQIFLQEQVLLPLLLLIRRLLRMTLCIVITYVMLHGLVVNIIQKRKL